MTTLVNGTGVLHVNKNWCNFTLPVQDPHVVL